MLMPRLVPVLLVDRSRRVVKTVGFGDRTYIGDPFNIIRLFNEKQVDEICVLDIDATVDAREPDFALVASLAAECFMPLSYGGGIATLEHARRLISNGVEKVVLRTHATDDLIGSIVHEFGAQAVVVCLDYRMRDRQRIVEIPRRPIDQEAARVAAAGAGELIIQSMDLDGSRKGMDIEGVATVARGSPVPVIALGGAADVDHLHAAIAAGADAAASGSAFAFIGRLRAVLITYPDYTGRSEAMLR